ncbi:TIGR03560 family F420-dependent LLM class oxidoreductase [Thermomicrobium sp. 4228-Ro]|uniref:TIGR03560 family F420-dependent LLM class oxidoreductase n=1 Tax=Thermomicrobium sp. 4228-Ro TaxID=2993937 RepID=UPI0022499D9B|nr:TIGR03560 family F420-dependent LLM class oxidoreductase [Thermomicrobium sp. 4228-Ro]MCX2726406.1 TIGR03560 family F420-dependent LLM class oxidoreductase [Thermomicrobium sp. 4228-Ro]
MQLGVMVAIQEDVTWDGWLRVVDFAERVGFESIWTSDHVWTVIPGLVKESLAMWPALTAAALKTSRVRLGQLVSPTTYRHPVELAQNAVALDHLSGGRYILGVGAGWQQREHEAFGFVLAPPGQRLARLREALEIIRQLWTGEPVTYSGRFFRLDGAVLRPPPLRPEGVPILIGGGGEQKTLRIVAEFADEWNPGFTDPDGFVRKNRLLEDYCRAIGRDPRMIERTLMLTYLIGRNQVELREKARKMAAWRGLDPGAVDPDRILGESRRRWMLVGTPREIAAQIRNWGALGVERIQLHMFDLDDLDGLDLLAREVVPLVTE